MLLALGGLSTPSAAEPVEVLVVDERPTDREASAQATVTLTALLYGLAAPASPDGVRVEVLGPGAAGGASDALGSWLGAAGRRRPRTGWSPADALSGRSDVAHRVVFAPAKDDHWSAALPALTRGPVSLVGASGTGKLVDACAASPTCDRYDPGVDPLSAAGHILLDVFADTPGVRVSTGDQAVIGRGAARVVVVTPGEHVPTVADWGVGRPLPAREASSNRIATGRIFERPPAGEHGIVDDAGKPLRALVVTVYPTVLVTDCSLLDDGAVRWQFASPELRGQGEPVDDVAFEVRFTDRGGRAQVQRVKADGPGRVRVPEQATGAFTITPITTTDPPIRLGERSACQPAIRALTTRLVATPEGDDGLLVRASFVDTGGEAVAAETVLAALSPVVALDGGPSANLEAVDGRAEARFDGLDAGRYLVTSGPVEDGRLALDRVALEVDVGQGGSGGGSPWRAALLAVVIVAALEILRPLVVGVLRRRRPRPLGTVALFVGDALVNERALDTNTAYPVLLAGIRELPIAQGELLARAEVTWDGWTPTFRAVVLGRRDPDDGSRRLRIESCALARATPYGFSNVRVEFVAAR